MIVMDLNMGILICAKMSGREPPACGIARRVNCLVIRRSQPPHPIPFSFFATRGAK